MKVYPLLELRVFVDDINISWTGGTKELPGVAEKVLKSTGREVEEKGLRTYQITEGGKEGKNKVIVAVWNFQECSKREGVSIAISVETPGPDLRTRTKLLGAEEKDRRKKCDVRFFLCKKESRLSETTS